MAELSTIARPYAEAAFELAHQESALGAWSQMLRFAATIVGDERVAAALDNPRLDAGAKESLLLSIAGDRFDAQARSFIHVLVDADRVALLPQIAAQFDALKDEAEATAKATIESAFELTEAQVAELKAALEKRFGKKMETTRHRQPRADRRGARDGRRCGDRRVGAGEARRDVDAASRLMTGNTSCN